MMLNTTEQWLADPDFSEPMEQCGLGVAVLEELTNAHEPLAELNSRRNLAQATLRTLIDAATELDLAHDRNARALNHHLQGLIEGAPNDAKAREYQQLEGLLFPIGLRVVKLPYIEEGGVAVELQRTVSPKVREQLASIVVGAQTLDDLFVAWITAGNELGKVVDQRAKLKASLAREGSAVGEIDTRAGRSKWVEAVRGLLWAININDKLRPLAERVHAALDEAINAKLRGRDSESSGGQGEGEGEGEVFAQAEDPEGEEGEDEALAEGEGEIDEDDQVAI